MKKIFPLFALLSVPCLLTAQDKKTDSVHQLSGVTVTATRKDMQFLAVPYSVSSLRRSELDDFQYRTVPEALQGMTGVFVQKTNHGGGSPFIRGLTGNQTLILVDGIRFNNATFRYGPNQYLNTIDAYTVSKLEVVRGSGSVQYGSDAMGGVLQLFTKDPSFADKKRFHATGILKATSQDMEYTGRGEIKYESPKLAFLAGYTNRRFGDLYGGDTTGKQSPSGYTEQGFDAKLKWTPVKDLVLTFAHQYLQQENVPLYHRVKLENFAYYFFSPQQRKLSYARLEAESRHPLFDKITLVASLQHTLENRSYLKNGNSSRFTEEDKVNTAGITADISSLIAKGWTANSGIEYYHDKVGSLKQQIAIAGGSTQVQRGLYPDNATSGNFSVYTLHHFSFKKMELEAGLRYNSFLITIPDTSSNPLLKLGESSIRPGSFVGNTAFTYHLSPLQRLYASFSTGYRAPNIDDMGTLGLVDFRYEVPAYGLRPEKTYNTEIGYRFENKIIQLSAALFYMHLTDLVTRVQVAGQQVGGYNVYTKENSQESFIRGAELSLACRLHPSLAVNMGAAYAYGQNLSRNEPMRRIPPFNGKLLVKWSDKAWSLFAENLFAAGQHRLAQGDKDDNRIPAGGTPGWHVLNAYAGYSIARFSIRTGIQNLFNVDYRTHGSGINGTGRSASLSFQFNL